MDLPHPTHIVGVGYGLVIRGAGNIITNCTLGPTSSIYYILFNLFFIY